MHCVFLQKQLKSSFCNSRTDFLKSNVQFPTVPVLLFFFRLGFPLIGMLSAKYNLGDKFNLVCL